MIMKLHDIEISKVALPQFWSQVTRVNVVT